MSDIFEKDDPGQEPDELELDFPEDTKPEPPKGDTGGDIIEKSQWIGIDLGTSTCSVAVFNYDQPTLIEIEGDKFMPSVFRIDQDGVEYVGAQAKAALIVDAENTVAFIKRHMGDKDWTKRFEGARDDIWTPTTIAAEYLKKLRSEAQKAGYGEADRAVICVPANFEHDKKAATREAAQKAGFQKVELLEEPIAAAIDFGFGSQKERRIFVYDFGGGTFDSTLLEVITSTDGGKNTFKVEATNGVPWLGGTDVDFRLTDHLAKIFLEKTGIDICNELDSDIRTTELRNARQILATEVEKAKITLSSMESAEVRIPVLISKDGATYSLKETITREEFNGLIEDLIDQSLECMDKTLTEARLKIGDVDQIVLVGGSSKIPLVKEKIKAKFGKDPYTATDADTAVAKGAAIYANWLTGDPEEEQKDPKKEPTGKKEESDIFPKPEDGETGPGTEGQEEPTPGDPPGPTKPPIDNGPDIQRMVTHYLGIALYTGEFDKLINKGAPLNRETPSQSKETTYVTSKDNQEKMVLSVYQTQDQAERVDTCRHVADLTLEGIPKGPKGSQKVKVKFSIDIKNNIVVEAEALGADGVKNELKHELA